MVTLMQRRRDMMRLTSISPTPTPSINDYVQDGIIFWLDGIENTRSGHNASATRWEDLSDNPLYFTYNNDSVIGDKYCIPNGKMAGTSRVTSTTESYTIEIVMELSTLEQQMLLPWKGNAYGTIWVRGSATPPVLAFSSGNNDGVKGVEIVSGINTYTARGLSNMMVNGIASTIMSSSASWASQFSQIGYYNSAYPRNATSKYYAIRIYNRILTDAEVAINVAVDTARFN